MTAAPKAPRRNEPEGVERPLPDEGGDKGVWGSDAIAEMLRALDIPYVALNPGASYRGLHDSLVNRLGNERPQMLLCLHEEAAVAIAHGWAKVTGKPMARGRACQCRADARHHGGLQRLVRPRAAGAAGRHRAGRRGQAPAVDRLDPHHPRHGALVRNYTKWDDQPASIAAAYESILRACKIAATAPRGPDLCLPRRRPAGIEARERCRPCPMRRASCPPGAGGPAADLAEQAARRLLRGAAAADPDGPGRRAARPAGPSASSSPRRSAPWC